MLTFIILFSLHIFSTISTSGTTFEEISEDIYVIISYCLTVINVSSLTYNRKKIHHLQRIITSGSDKQDKIQVDLVEKCELFIRLDYLNEVYVLLTNN